MIQNSIEMMSLCSAAGKWSEPAEVAYWPDQSPSKTVRHFSPIHPTEPQGQRRHSLFGLF